MNDARFEDAPLADKPLRLRAEGADDLTVISSLMQDAVGRAGDISWLPRKRRLSLELNRFRWEDSAEADQGRRPYQRVRSALIVESVLAVRARGLTPNASDQVFELLAILFEPGTDGAGILTLTMAGGAEIAAEIECLDIALADLTQPWAALSGKAPEHWG